MTAPVDRGIGRGRWWAKKLARILVGVLDMGGRALGRRGVANGSRVRVLTYHRFGGAGRDPFSVSANTFEEQMKWLVERQRVVSLEQIERFVTDGEGMDAGGVLVTIDDGEDSVWSHAWPVLQKYGIPAVVFVIGEKMGQSGYLGEEQIRSLSNAGIRIGSHSMSHRRLAQLGREEIRWELVESKARLESCLGGVVDTLAYPYGTLDAFNAEVAALAREAKYRTAFTSQHGGLRPGMEPVMLPRIKVEGGDPGWLFPKLCEGALDRWIWIDKLLWRLQRPQLRR